MAAHHHTGAPGCTNALTQLPQRITTVKQCVSRVVHSFTHHLFVSNMVEGLRPRMSTTSKMTTPYRRCLSRCRPQGRPATRVNSQLSRRFSYVVPADDSRIRREVLNFLIAPQPVHTHVCTYKQQIGIRVHGTYTQAPRSPFVRTDKHQRL